MDFFIILKCSVFFLLITVREEFPLSNIIFVGYVLQIKLKLSKPKNQFLSHFIEFTAEQVLKSLSGINNSLELHVS